MPNESKSKSKGENWKRDFGIRFGIRSLWNLNFDICLTFEL